MGIPFCNAFSMGGTLPQRKGHFKRALAGAPVKSEK
jgi:hypothetical protein